MNLLEKIQNDKKLRRSMIWAGIVLLWLVFWWRAIVEHQVFYIRDLTFYTLPMKTFMMEQFSHGEFPFWTPRLSTGMPFFAEPSHQVLYLMNLVFFLTPTIIDGINWYVLLHLLLAGPAMIYLCRSAGADRWASVWAGLCYSVCGYVVSITDNTNYLPAVVWLPLSAAFFVRGLAKTTATEILKYSFAASLTLSMMLFAGDAFHPTFFGVFAVMFLLLRWWKPQLLPGASLKLTGLHLLATFGTIGLITAVQILPTWELLKLSVRQETLAYDETTLWSFPPARLIEFIMPFFYGSKYETFNYSGPHFIGMFMYPKFREPWADSVYIGIIPVLLALAGAFWQPRRGAFWLVLVVAGLILSFGGFLDPLYQVFTTLIPPLKTHRYLEKFIFFVHIGILVLAALGASSLFQRGQALHEKLSKLTLRGSPVIFRWVLSGLWMLGSLYLFLKLPAQWWIDTHAMERSVEWGANFYERGPHLTGLAWHWILLSGLVSLFVWLPRPLLARYFILLMLAALLDLFGVHFQHTPLAPAELLTGRPTPTAIKAINASNPPGHVRIFYDDGVDYPEAKTDPVILKRLAKAYNEPVADDSFNHYWLYRVLYNQQRMLFNYGILYGLNYQNGRFAPLQPTNHKRMDMVMVEHAPYRFLELSAVNYIMIPIRIFDRKSRGPLFDASRSDIYTDNNRWEKPGYTVVGENRLLNLQIIKIENAVPRAYLAPNFVYNPEPMAVYKIVSEQFRAAGPTQIIEIHQPPPDHFTELAENETPRALDQSAPDNWKDQVFIVSDMPDYESGFFEAKVYSPYDQAFFVLTEGWFPGWEATVDGKPAPVVMANQRFMAVPLEKGGHMITLRYHSTYFMPGLLLSLLGLMLAMGGIFIWPRVQRGRH